MTDHHHLKPSDQALTILYTVGEYRAGSDQREVLLVDTPGRGLTLVDVLASSDDDQHVVADRLENLSEAGDVADAHMAKSIALGRPAAPTAEPPTEEQLRSLRSVANAVGAAFVPPTSKHEAAKWIERSSPSRWRPATEASA